MFVLKYDFNVMNFHVHVMYFNIIFRHCRYTSHKTTIFQNNYKVNFFFFFLKIFLKGKFGKHKKINSGNTFSNQYQKKLVKFRYNEHILRKKYDSDKIG